MIPSLDTPANNHLQERSVFLAGFLKITLTDGRVFAFTNHMFDLDVDGVTYSATEGHTPSAIHTTNDMSVDNIDVEVLRTATGITLDEILAGDFDSAEFIYFLRNWKDLSQNYGLLRKGTLGRVTSNRSNFIIELRGLLEAFTKQILEMVSPGCRADVGDARCKVPLDPGVWLASTTYTQAVAFDAGKGGTVKPTTPNNRYFRATTAGTTGASEPTWNTTLGGTTVDGTVIWTTIEAYTVAGSVTNISSAPKRVFQDTSIVKPDTFFDGGLLTWVTGLNTGKQFEIKRFEDVGGNPEFELILSTFRNIQIGDTYTVSVGCTKRLDEDCITKFDNVHNMRAHPYVPHNFSISRATI